MFSCYLVTVYGQSKCLNIAANTMSDFIGSHVSINVSSWDDQEPVRFIIDVSP